MFNMNLPKLSPKIKPAITNLARASLQSKNRLRSKANFIFPAIVIGTVIYENYEKLFSSFGMSHSRIKKKFDKWKGVEELEKTVDINISDLNLLTEEDYVVKISQPLLEAKEKTHPVEKNEKSEFNLNQSELSKISEEFENILINEIPQNKKNLTLNLIEKEQFYDNLTKEKLILLNQIKSQRVNQNKIINELKEKLTSEEFSNLEMIRQVLNEEKLQIEQLNVINLVLPIGEKYKRLNDSIEDLNKWTNEYNKLNENLVNLSHEIAILNQNLKKFSELEENSKSLKNSLKIENSLIRDTSTQEVDLGLNKSDTSIEENKTELIVNTKLFDNMKKIYDNIVNTNNRKNLELFNNLYSNLKKKLISISEETKDEFSIDILKNSALTQRIFSHVEIENEFEAIKKDLFCEILTLYFNSCANLKAFSPYLAYALSNSSKLFLNKYDPWLDKIDENDSDSMKLYKAFNFLADNIKYKNYSDAFKCMKYFEKQERLTSDLRNKLEVMTREAMAIELLKKHLV